MSTVRVPAQVQYAVIDMLTERIARPGLQVRATVPKGWGPDKGPLLIVSHDGSTGRDWPVATTDTIRLTTWTAEPDPDLIRLAIGACLDVPISGVARAKPGVWPLAATDPTTHAHLESATVLLTVRTEEKGL